MNKKIFITGSGGFVGKYLYQNLKNDFVVLGVDKIKNNYVDKVIDISDEGALFGELDAFFPDVVVHLAALSHVEKCETEKELADKQNILPTKHLADWVKKSNKRMVYISSDYVYDGSKGNFDENDLENPIQYYGQEKLAGERLVAGLERYVILRPTVIYGWDEDGMNFFMQMYRNYKNNKDMNVPVDQINNPTYVVDLCELIKNILPSDIVGKFNATGNESCSRYDFALKICEVMGWDKNFIKPVATKDLNQVAKRPLNNSTSNKLISKKLNFTFSGLEESLQAVKNRISLKI